MNARTLPRHAESTILSDARTLLETIYADAIMDSNLVRSRKSVKVIKCPVQKTYRKNNEIFQLQSTIVLRTPRYNGHPDNTDSR